VRKNIKKGVVRRVPQNSYKRLLLLPFNTRKEVAGSQLSKCHKVNKEPLEALT